MALLALASAATAAPEAATSDRRTRDEELPKVLYIVPWKEIEVDRTIPPMTIQTDEVLVPLDREMVQRWLRPEPANFPSTAAGSDVIPVPLRREW
jgi:hypothetical protein